MLNKLKKSLMFLNFGRIIFAITNHRLYSSSGGPIQMAYDIYEGKKTDNSKTSLIIMHGLFGQKQNWRTVARSLVELTSRKIFTVDVRNHGYSPHTNEHDSTSMVMDVIEFMHRHSIKPSSVLGHSMGGRTMMLLALQHPDYVKEAIIVDISPLSLPNSFHYMQEIFAAMKAVNIPPGIPLIDARKLTVMELKKAIEGDDLVNFISMNLYQKNGKFFWKTNIDALSNAIRNTDKYQDRISGQPPYKGNTLFVCGRYSPYLPPASWPQIQKLFPNAEIQWLETGHLPHLEQPTEFVEIVANFLNK